MATYVIGDVQGCHRSLERLLERCAFGSRDQLWFTGDLVNRGPDSLAVLRLAHQLGDRCTTVLGNHDLHLLRMASEADAGRESGRSREMLRPVLDADDADELLTWLRDRPLVHDAAPWLMVHAGPLPAWDLEILLDRAHHAEEVLRSERSGELLARLAKKADPELDRNRSEDPVLEAVATIRVLTNLRCVDREGRPQLSYTGPPEEAPRGWIPWYEHPQRRALDRTVLCGHWAAQGVRRTPDMVALDSGCVWGHYLSAFRLEDEALFTQECGESGSG